ncbi:hypothetical protein SEEM162_19211 [Salmonella enterica subsp. enterica serovar Senftenberg str. 316235162]|nr:hypothetical protein SEEM162_19211 [Salmonella enterica subsp. enterica serovar Senftenberg str. 316235162]
MLVSTGLSPLARGTRQLEHTLSRSVRFIPAGAGNTTSDVSAVSMVPVYPRWRGEHGSPGRSSQILTGFIPAGAGNTQV